MMVVRTRDLLAASPRTLPALDLSCARGEAEPRTHVDDGVRALEAVFAVNRSLAEGRTVSLARAAAA